MPASNASTFRSPMLMNTNDTAVVVIDMQEKLLPAIGDGKSLLRSVERLVRGAGMLSVPVFYTEQYPRGLGNTVDALPSDTENTFEKKMFSLRECSDLMVKLKNMHIANLVLVGVEAHICVLQSALDSIANGFNVSICVDAVGTRNEHDKTVALRRLDSSGVALTTVESALFQWCETAEHPQFKAISKLIK